MKYIDSYQIGERKMKNVLVTGGAGFIGANFIRFLLDKEPDISIINLDLLTYAGNLSNLENLRYSARHKLVVGNISDRILVEELISDYEIDSVFHFAAESHVDRSIYDGEVFIKTNILGTYVLLEACKNFWSDFSGKRFHHISTDEVFGSLALEDFPFTEHSQYGPRSLYAASKAGSDHLVKSYFHTHGLPITITNCSNNYGPYQYPEKLIPLTIRNCLEGNPIPIYGDGQQIRDWIYVNDHCSAIYQVFVGGKNGESYNVGGNNQKTNIEVVKKVCQILDNKLPSSPLVPYQQLIKFVADRPGHDFRYAMNINRISNELGWKPIETFKNGIEKTVDWYLENRMWLMARK